MDRDNINETIKRMEEGKILSDNRPNVAGPLLDLSDYFETEHKLLHKRDPFSTISKDIDELL